MTIRFENNVTKNGHIFSTNCID